jgi:branched-chain amino acid aminotransferase
MVFEMTRTFNRIPFKFQEHMDRLYASMKYLGISIPYTREELILAHKDLLMANRKEFSDTDEIRSLINVSRGTLPIYGRMGLSMDPWVMMTTFPLRWITAGTSRTYDHGVHAVIPSQRTIPASLLEPKVKNRSRMHYKMADMEVRRADPTAWALLLDPDGFIAEGSGSNFFMVKNRELFTPEPRNILRGITRQYVMDLARKLKIEVFERNLELYDVMNCDEAFFTNTPNCVVPITKINGSVIGKGHTGRVTDYLSHKFEEAVDCDWRDQVLGWDESKS